MGRSVAEAAALLDVSDKTVKSYLHRAPRLLHALLDERGSVSVQDHVDRWLREAVCHHRSPPAWPNGSIPSV